MVLVHLLVVHGRVHARRHDQDLEVDPIHQLAVAAVARLGPEVDRGKIIFWILFFYGPEINEF